MSKKHLVKLACRIESEEYGGTYYFKPPDRAINRFLSYANNLVTARKQEQERLLGRALAAEEQAAVEAVNSNDDDLPPELLDTICDLFTEGVIGWQGVCDEAEVEIACNAFNKQMVDTPVKIAVGFAYMQQWGEAQEKKATPSTPPMNCMPPDASADTLTP